MSIVGQLQFVDKMLDRYRSMTMDALLARIPDKEPRRHLYDLVPLYPQRSGKGLRPSLCLATCGAFGGPIDRALCCAIAIELFHNAFLVHDDVEDGSEYRRGSPTLNTAYGVPIAVNVGDAMNVLSMRSLMENLEVLGPQLTWRIFAEIEHMAHQSVEGQAMELGWVHENVCDLSEEHYLRMTLKKTCWYTCIHPCRIGGLVATAGGVNPDRFNLFGYYMGAAFQIQDDILNLVGEERQYGKEIGGDIWEGKRTLMLIHTLNRCSREEKRQMSQFLMKKREVRTRAQVEWVYQIMEKYDSIAFARSCARQLAGAALLEFTTAYGDQPSNEHKDFVESLVLYMVNREL